MTDTMLHQAAVDTEFRELLIEGGFTALPAEIDALDMSGLDTWTAETIGRDVYACGSTCSFGPLTFYCDGTSK
jgi:hypothetical protein